MMDPLAGSAWSRPETVAGFAQSSPNPVLMPFAPQRISELGAAAFTGDPGVPLRELNRPAEPRGSPRWGSAGRFEPI